MKIITGGRGAGKTYELVKLSSENNVPILCASSTIPYIKDVTNKLDLIVPAPIDILRCRANDFYGIDKVYVDNAEYIINVLLKTMYGVTADVVAVDNENMITLKKDDLTQCEVCGKTHRKTSIKRVDCGFFGHKLMCDKCFSTLNTKTTNENNTNDILVATMTFGEKELKAIKNAIDSQVGYKIGKWGE